MEFHISRKVRDKYQFDQSLYQLTGNVIFGNFHAIRKFTQKINQKKDLLHFPEQAVKAGQINAMGLIDEILHIILALYREQRALQVTEQAVISLQNTLGHDSVDSLLRLFLEEFPPLAVYRQEISIDEYLEQSTEGITNRAVTLEELLMLWLANQNPAFSPYIEFFEDDILNKNIQYPKFINELCIFFEKQPVFGPKNQNIVDMLRSPAIAAPHSLKGQLEYIRLNWTDLLGKYFYRLLTGLDLIKEEEKMHFPGTGDASIPIYQRSLFDDEGERFSQDKEWMPRLVLLAKNIHVWLDQLSKKYGKSISKLNEIPDQELDLLSRRGFSGLWLIGVWDRSTASARIKQICGNPEAIASAYSLKSYTVASDLGGETAYENFRDRAWQRGVRLASDMVPNHMGIDSYWVIDHPDWFVSLDYCPFPSYSFTGENLSSNERIGVYIEDHYFDRSDAAVVFKHVEHHTNHTRYIYHGNDGTSMPWNDTAQLNYLLPEVREAVIQTIINVAKKFPIIRFDAAMTLTKRHYQRLWFPEPGSGGDIPSRAEHGMSKYQFDQIMPQEFWREVVDRIAVEAPDTLLLAEAFWLMEGYFVRTLGMHRVYNSAFMIMLRDEDNVKYRKVIKNTLEFEPEILKRYVNFMNNPDERTAIDQYGKGDKYFGICIMMITLPGLPMFGHGQIEGFSEKYGMEYRRSYWDEQPDGWLVERHEREIFPLLHKRALFAEVINFLFYDFFSIEGYVNEDVFAYSNRLDNECVLVVYQNRFSSAQGWVHTSVGFSIKGNDGQRQVIQRSIKDGLNLHEADDTYIIFRDSITGLEYIRPIEELCNSGLFLILDAYKYHVFMDFYQVKDDTQKTYRALCEYLNGQGVPSINGALEELMLRPVQIPFLQIAHPGYLKYLLTLRKNILNKEKIPDTFYIESKEKMMNLLLGIEYLQKETFHRKIEIISKFDNELNFLMTFSPDVPSLKQVASIKQELHKINKFLLSDENHWLVILTSRFIHSIGMLINMNEYENISLSWMDEWRLGKILFNAFLDIGKNEDQARRMLETVQLLIEQQSWHEKCLILPLDKIVEMWFAEMSIQRFLKINRFNDILWFEKEAFVEFIWWMETQAIIRIITNRDLSTAQITEQIISVQEICHNISAAEKKSDFQVDKLITSLK